MDDLSLCGWLVSRLGVRRREQGEGLCVTGRCSDWSAANYLHVQCTSN